jgi:osmotically-inducible protein OsmY
MGSEMNETTDIAKQRIRHQPQLTFQRIWCEYDGGRLFLRGQVPTFHHKQLAQPAVAGMAGVDQVVNDIEVVW